MKRYVSLCAVSHVCGDLEEIDVEDFVGGSEGGVVVTVTGLENGAEFTPRINREEAAYSDIEWDGDEATFTVYGEESDADLVDYLGEYSVSVSYGEDSETPRLTEPVTFSVVANAPENDDVTEPALIIDPEEIALEDFVQSDPEDDDAGVDHRVEGLEPGTAVSYTVTGPEGVTDFTQNRTADDEGVLEFVIHGFDVADPTVYLGDYTTVVTYDNEEDETAELSGSFAVVADDGTPAAGDGGDETPDLGTDDDSAAPAGGTSSNLNNDTGLAQTGATGVHLGLLAGALLLVGGAFVAFANRARLFGRKH